MFLVREISSELLQFKQERFNLHFTKTAALFGRRSFTTLCSVTSKVKVQPCTGTEALYRMYGP